MINGGWGMHPDSHRRGVGTKHLMIYSLIKLGIWLPSGGSISLAGAMAVTLETIARRLKISKVTVSNAMRGSGRISEKTRQRILAMAKELGYRPNPLVTALMSDLRRKRSGRRCTLAFLNFFPGKDDWREHPTFVQFHLGAQRRAEELGYHLEFHWQGEVDGNSRRLGDILYARGIPGIVLAPLGENGVSINIDWSRFATVAIGHTFREFNPHRVSNHQFHSMRLAMDNLVAKGMRRIGLVVPKMDDERVENAWVSGYLASQLHHELPVIAPLITPTFKTAAAIPWIRKHRIEVVVSTNHHLMSRMQEAGIRVPEDVGFVHLDWSAEKGDMAGVNQCSELIGAAAVDLLIEQLNNNEIGIPERTKTVMIDGVWHDGPSLRAAARG
jgi:DNA-binding LacI/PurR family transcriptional regulator